MSDNEPLVSVLMTAFNREKYIAEAIESVLSSWYKNFELIIVDDCSKDMTVDIAKNYSTMDERIKVYVNEKNLGDYPNRNRAASYAKGKYLKYVDADDLIYPHGLQVMVNSMEKFPEAALGLSKQVNNLEIYPVVIGSEEAYHLHFLNERGFFSNGPASCIIKHDCFKEVGGFPEIRHVGDTSMWLKLSARYPIVKLLPGLTHWRRHDEQENVFSRTSIKRKVLNFNAEMNALLDTNCSLNSSDKALAIKLLKKKYGRIVIRLFAKGNFEDASVLAKSIDLSSLEYINSFRLPRKL